MDIKDITSKPTFEELESYINNEYFKLLYTELEEKYKALVKIEFSKDVWFYGWNIKFRKAGKSLCVVYPRDGYFLVLLVVSQKEKESVEELLSSMSKSFQEIYKTTKEGNGQRWMMIEFNNQKDLVEDI